MDVRIARAHCRISLPGQRSHIIDTLTHGIDERTHVVAMGTHATGMGTHVNGMGANVNHMGTLSMPWAPTSIDCEDCPSYFGV